MCRPVDHWVAALLLLWVAFGIAAGILQRRFAVRLKNEEPAVWRDLRTWHRWNENSELHESAVISYLLQGFYRDLSNAELISLGSKTRGFAVASIGLLFIYGAVVVISRSGLVPACYWP